MYNLIYMYILVMKIYWNSSRKSTLLYVMFLFLRLSLVSLQWRLVFV